MKKLYAILAGAALMAGSASAQDIYIIGGNINGQSWDDIVGAEFCKMTNNGDGSYTWQGEVLGNGFKFNDGSWSGEYNIGSTGVAVDLDKPAPWSVEVQNNPSSGDIKFSIDTAEILNPTVNLYLNYNIVTIDGTLGDAGIHYTIAGNFNGWNGKDSAYELEEKGGLYVGTFDIPAEAEFDGVTEGSQFKVVLNGIDWYGAPDDACDASFLESNTVSLTLDGGTNVYFIDFEGGTVTFAFNPDTKDLTLTLGESGVEGIAADVNGAKVIYNLQGVKVANPVKGQFYIVNGKKVVY